MTNPSVTITLDSVDGWPVVRAAGEVDLDAVPGMRQAVAGVVARQPRSVLIFDLRAVTFMDGSGLSILVSALRGLRRWQGEVVVITEQARVLRVLKLSGADR